MTRSPFVLAALASSAVPGLDPVSVESVRVQAGHQFEVAFVQDSQDRRWVVRAPVSTAASAQMDLTVALLGLLSRRLPYAVPAPRGFAPLKEGGRAMVYPFVAGRSVDLAGLPAGPGLAAEIGRAVGQLHNVDLALYEEAGVPAYDPETYRSRRLAELDRAAATGSVPSALLSRWEEALEEVSMWRFAPTPTHGALTGHHVLAAFDDEQDAATGHVRGLTGWEQAKVADPADDFAELLAAASPDAVDSVLEAYAHVRVERPDPHLRRRARLAGELAVVSGLLAALTSDRLELAQSYATKLREMESEVARGSREELVERPEPVVPVAPLAPASRPTVAPESRSTVAPPEPAERPSIDQSSTPTVALNIGIHADREAADEADEPAFDEVGELVDDNSDDGEPDVGDELYDDTAEAEDDDEAGYDLGPVQSARTTIISASTPASGSPAPTDKTELIDVTEYSSGAAEKGLAVPPDSTRPEAQPGARRSG